MEMTLWRSSHKHRLQPEKGLRLWSRLFEQVSPTQHFIDVYHGIGHV
jgi:hypothetical protein